jgi:hypothetical protein
MTMGRPAADPQGAPAEILEHKLALVMNGGGQPGRVDGRFGMTGGGRQGWLAPIFKS